MIPYINTFARLLNLNYPELRALSFAFIISRKDTDRAIQLNNLALVEMFVNKGATKMDLFIWLKIAIKYNQLDIINYFISKGADICICMSIAAEFGNLPLVEYFVSLGATNFVCTIYYATVYGYIDIVYYCYNKDNTLNLNQLLENAAEHGHLSIVIYLIWCGANNFNKAMEYASRNNHLHIIEYLIDKGANDFDSAIKIARSWNQHQLIDYYINKIDEQKYLDYN
jgi:ankyrin repeat protein